MLWARVFRRLGIITPAVAGRFDGWWLAGPQRGGRLAQLREQVLAAGQGFIGLAGQQCRIDALQFVV